MNNALDNFLANPHRSRARPDDRSRGDAGNPDAVVCATSTRRAKYGGCHDKGSRESSCMYHLVTGGCNDGGDERTYVIVGSDVCGAVGCGSADV